jgi:Xaa-Pro aminopeptidase
MTDYRRRIGRLQSEMRAQRTALAVIGATDNMLYLAGWRAEGHERLIALLVPADREPALLVPVLNEQEARANPAGIARAIGWDDAAGWLPAMSAILAEWGIAAGAVLVDDELSAAHLLALQSLLPAARWAAAGAAMAGLREVKADDELRALEEAGALIDAICESAIGRLAEGVTERDVADLILAEMKLRDTEPSFAPLVCFGANGAMPHHTPDLTRLRRGDLVVIDIGCRRSGYASDITRTASFGAPSDPEAAAVYGIVSRAHWAAREAALPGASAADVDAAARRVIADAGYGDFFIHRTGHGIGISPHESPNIVAGSATPLRPGMCFSIEPGIYLPGRFGVRIENIVAMTGSGARSLNADPPRDLRIVAV